MNAGTLQVELLANLARFQADMDSATRTVGGATSAMERSIDSVKRAFGLMAGAMIALGAKQIFTSIIDEQEKFQRNLLRTEALLKSNGHAAGLSAAELRKNAQELALATLQSVEGVEEAQQILLTFTNITGGTFLRATEAAANLATVTGTGLSGSMTMLGKALNDPIAGITAMTRAGVSFSEQQKETIKKLVESNKLFDAQKLILDELSVQYGGVAKAEAMGLAGAFDTLAQRTQEAKIAIADFGAVGVRGAEIINKLAEYVNDFSVSVRTGEGPIAKFGSALLTAAKIAVGYFAIFVAAPAIYTLVTAAAWKLIAAIATYAMNVVIGQTATFGFNTALFGTSVSADLASGSLTKLKLAGSVLFAAFAGWQFGSYLSDQFVQARVVGLLFVGAMLKGWENMKYSFALMGEAISFGWDTTVNGLKTAFAAFVSIAAKGYGLLGMSETSADVEAYAESLRAAGNAQGTFSEQTAGLAAAHAASIAAIDAEIDSMAAWELANDGVVAGVAKLADEIRKPKPPAAAGMTEEQKKAHADMMKQANDFIATLKREGEEIGLAADQMKMLNAARAAAKAPLKEQREEIMRLALANDIAAKAEKARADEEAQAIAIKKAGLDAAAQNIASIHDEARALEFKVATFGKLPAQITAMQIAELQSRAQSKVLTKEGLALINLEIAALQRKAAAQTASAAQESPIDLAAATQLLDVMTALDDQAQKAASSMAASFGRVGSAIGGLTTAMTGFGKTQAAIAAQYADAWNKANGDKAKQEKANTDRAKQSAQAQIGAYGDMAGAAKGFFKENSTGYKALEAAEKAFRAIEMAMALQSMLTKSGLLSAFTGAVITAEAAKTQAEVASVGPSVAASAAKGQASAVAGVANQAGGDPYSAFVRIAAMVAIMGALGFAVAGGSSGGGGMSAADAQKSQGSGGVFGDKSAQSDSISKSLEMLKANSDSMLPINRGMLTALQNIESAMGGLTNLLVRTPGVVEGTNMGIQEGVLKTWRPTGVGNLPLDFVGDLWGKLKQSIVDSGLKFGGSVNDLQAGRGYSQYASVDTTKSSWFGLKKETTNTVQTAGLSAELSSQFGKIFVGVEEALKQAAIGLGSSADAVAATLDGLKIASTNVSLKGLSGAKLTEALNAVLSKAMDDMASAVFPELDAFRQVGEGYTETVIRLASNSMKLDSVLSGISGALGATGMASIKAREYLLNASGGIEEFAAQTRGFAENFLSESERLVPVQAYVTKELAAMGLSGITTRDQFKDAVLGLAQSGALATEAGADTYAGLMRIQDAFVQVTPAAAEAAQQIMTAAEIMEQRAELQDRYNELTFTATQVEEQRRATIDASNLALYDSIIATERANAIADERAELQQQLNELTMTETQLLDQKRDSYDEANRALYDQVIAAEAAKKAAQDLATVNAGWEKQIHDVARSMMSASELYADDTKNMKDSTKALYGLYLTRVAEKKAIDDAKKAVADMITTLANGLKLAQSAATTAMAAVTATINGQKADAQKAYDKKMLDLAAAEKAVRESNAAAVKDVQIRQKLAKEAYDDEVKLIEDEKKAAVTAYGLAVEAVKKQQKAIDTAHKTTMAGIKAKEVAENAQYKAASDAMSKAAKAVDTAYKAATSAITNERQAAVKAYGEATKIIGEQIKAATGTVSRLSQLGDALSSTLSNLKLNGQESQYRSAAQATVRAALETARAGGPLPDTKLLTDALRTIQQPSEHLFQSFTDYQRDYQLTANDITELAALTAGQLTEAQIQLAMLESTRDAAALHHEALLLKLDEQRAALDAANESQKTVADAAKAALDLKHQQTMEKFDAQRAAAEASNALQEAAFDRQLQSMADAQDALIEALDSRRDVLDVDYSATTQAFEDELTRLAEALEQSLGGIDTDRANAARMLEEEIKRLDLILEQAQKEYDIAMGTYNALLPLPTALKNLADALAALARARDVADPEKPPTADASVFAMQIINDVNARGGYDKLMAEQAAMINQIAPSLDEIAKANLMYRQILGRNAEGDSAAGLAARMKNGLTEAQAYNEMVNSAEYKARKIGEDMQREVGRLVNVGLGTGIDFDALFNGSHANGLASVPWDGYIAELHKGEMVVPERQANVIRSGARGGSGGGIDTSALERRIEDLIVITEKQAEMIESHLYAVAKNTLNTADFLDGAVNGDVPLMVEVAA